MVGRVPEATGAGRADAFAELLLELKERSGLSYGALAKRLHMSTSTLHRYCSGAAVPNEYAPVERLARACRATPQELMELHRRWILADAVRGGGRGRRAVPYPRTFPYRRTVPYRPTAVRTPRRKHPPPPPTPSSPTCRPRPRPTPPRPPAVAVPPSSPPSPWPPYSEPPRSPPKAPSAAARTTPEPGVPCGATSVTTGKAQPPHPSASDSPTPSPSRESGGSGETRKPSTSTSAFPPRTTTPGAPNDGAGQGAADPADGDDAVPLNVATRPYIYDNPCSQHFLVDSEPEQVGPPASEQDAPRWAAAYGAVSSGEQRVALTVQGTGQDTVVLEALHVRVVTKGAPLAWNDYAMGVGCGGGVDTKSFDIDLDNGSPTVDVKNGQRDFPYKVSESDPEIFYITAHAAAHDVRWDLSLEWSSGSRRGTVHIDNSRHPVPYEQPALPAPATTTRWAAASGSNEKAADRSSSRCL